MNTIGGLFSSRYEVPSGEFAALSVSAERRVYCVKREVEPWLVVRAYAPDADGVRERVAGLSFLARHGYPAPRLLRAADGAEFVMSDEWQMFVTTYIAGETLDYTPEHLGLLGAALGRLHTLDPEPLRAAEWRPAVQIPLASARLAEVSARRSPTWDSCSPPSIAPCPVPRAGRPTRRASTRWSTAIAATALRPLRN